METGTQKNLKKLIIVPVYNEEKNLPQTIADLRAHTPGWDILIVNDCSTDRSVEVAKTLNLPVVSLPINLGIGGAVQTGFKFAKAHNYDMSIQFDGDGQHDARLIPLIAKPVENGEVDLCIGSRFVRGYNTFKSSFARKTGMILFSYVYRFLTFEKISDTTSGFRCYSKSLMNYYARNYPVDFPDLPVVLSAKKMGFRIREVEVTMKLREHGVSSTGFWKSIFYPFRTVMASLAIYLSRGNS